jgi:DegT/DnrJ/EryC1/StrS aminotransferase family protein
VSLEQQIEGIIGDRTGRECLMTPSGRVALWIALRHWLSPGNRILMSPFTDDVVFFVVLAAGLRPVMAPLSTTDGNIDIESVSGRTWSSVQGVLTTNLYGLPDRVVELRSLSQQLGIPMIEDAAHAIETEVDGQAIGTFGTAAVFSLSKHVAATGGGALVFTDPASRMELERLRNEVTTRRTVCRQAFDILNPFAERMVRAMHLVRPARVIARSLGLVERAGGNRMPLREPLLREAIALAPDLVRFHPWIRYDLHPYRMVHRRYLLRQMMTRLSRLDQDRARRVEGMSRLRELPLVAPAALEGPPRALLRVPLLVENRDAVQRELRRRLIGTPYVFDPPLDDYAGPEFADASTNPHAARWWAHHVLPVDPLAASRVLDVLTAVKTELRPARLQIARRS